MPDTSDWCHLPDHVLWFPVLKRQHRDNPDPMGRHLDVLAERLVTRLAGV